MHKKFRNKKTKKIFKKTTKKGAFAPTKSQNFSTTKPYIHFFPIHPFTCPWLLEI